MKYKYNGEWIDVNIKALDSMPVGSQVEFTGEDIPTGWEEVNDYSTTEINTGKKWIDGKPIYRKVYTGTTPSSDGSLFATSNMNIDEIIKEEMLVKKSNGHVVVNGMGYEFSIPINGNGYFSSSDAGYHGVSCVLILEYTKTTD